MKNRALRTVLSSAMMLLFAVSLIPQAWANPNDKGAEAVGVWLSGNGKEKFEIYRKGDQYFGKIIWTSYNRLHGDSLKDLKNPDPEKRNRSIIGLEILSGFEYKGDGQYSSGRVYDPGSGNSYKCRIRVEGDVAQVRGYILMPLIGRTETARRINQ